MLTTFPAVERIDVPLSLASDLFNAAERLPAYDNKEFYSLELQQTVRDRVRESCPESFDWLIKLIRERIAQWPYWVLLNGLHFDEGNKVFVAINRAFGELVARPYEKPRAQLVHYVQPATDLPSARGGHESERLHTDTADWNPPVELISMVCRRADSEGGGRSRILDVETARDEVSSKLGDETLQLLESTPVPWQLAPDCGGGVSWRPVLTKSSICWRRYTIDLALDSGEATLSKKMLDLLDVFEEVIGNTPRTTDFLMREGELLFSDNLRTIHARTPISETGGADRLMIRSWIRTS